MSRFPSLSMLLFLGAASAGLGAVGEMVFLNAVAVIMCALVASVAFAYQKRLSLRGGGIVMLVIVSMASLGVWRASAALSSVRREIAAVAEGDAQWQGIVLDFPQQSVRSTSAQISSVSGVPGKVQVTFPLGAVIPYGGVISWRCKLVKIAIDNPSGLTQAARGVRAECFSRAPPTVLRVGESPLSCVARIRGYARRAFSELAPEPEASLMFAVLFGGSVALPDALKNDFVQSGTSHILTVSGYKVHLFAAVALMLAAVCTRRNAVARAASLALLWVFVWIVGAGATVIRAGIIATLACIAAIIGRRADIPRLAVIAAAAMLLWAPLLIYDAAFVLSWMATVGLLLFSNACESALSFIPTRFHIRALAAESCAATLGMAPALLWMYGVVSLGSILANILIIPLVLPLLATSFVSLLLYAISPALAAVPATLALCMFRYAEAVASVFSQALPLDVSGAFGTALLVAAAVALWLRRGSTSRMFILGFYA